jgi:hypothetical protein
MTMKTTNGENALDTTSDNSVDLFFAIGASRNNQEAIKGLFEKAMKKDPLVASAVVSWSRDARKGAGERKTFRTLLSELITIDEDLAKKVIDMIPEIGRYDDLRVANGTALEDHAINVWKKGLDENNELAYKWVNIKKDNNLRKSLGLTPRLFRKKIVAGRPNIVEKKMCGNKWDEINYPQVPSVCMKKNSKAFRKHDGKRFEEWVDDTNQKVNASVLFPHQVYQTYTSGDHKLANKMWDNMKLDVSGNMLPIIDVSGSMSCPASQGVTCLDVSISLGTYIAQKNNGAFKNKAITFSETPKLINIPSTSASDAFSFVRRLEWGYTTNLESAYSLLLREAKKFNVTQKDLPEYLLILSDMQFNEATGNGYSYQAQKTDTSFEKMKKAFNSCGYELPTIIYWNLNANYNNFPTSETQENVCLVSGFSPFVLEAITKANLNSITPKNIMLNVIEPYLKRLK